MGRGNLVGHRAFFVDSETRIVGRCGRAVELGDKQFKLFKLLLDADGHGLTQSALEKFIWPGGCNDPSFSVTLCGLNKKLAHIFMHTLDFRPIRKMSRRRGPVKKNYAIVLTRGKFEASHPLYNKPRGRKP